MTFFNIGSKILKANSESILVVCEWETDEEGNAELVSITNRADTESFEMVTQIIDGYPVIYKLGAIRPLNMFQAVWLTRRAMPIYKREADDHKELYICDPKLYIECPKTNCYINGGPCRHTSYKEFAVKEEKLKCPYTNEPCDDWDCYWCEKGQGDG